MAMFSWRWSTKANTSAAQHVDAHLGAIDARSHRLQSLSIICSVPSLLSQKLHLPRASSVPERITWAPVWPSRQGPRPISRESFVVAPGNLQTVSTSESRRHNPAAPAIWVLWTHLSAAKP
ncbi:hypothetical protein PPTG_22474 [Phytophthora nicotianae INRA-310]|uniref:Uncharacterized protein n=1 Tax=Phytophthora nicotianae (strain INRA-310) TaxID=761204 RepID=W2QJ81_PHYN3|nr:hypothetical protein PPTG_22474 [Phytophthora nicotianae INRA-310]ETN12280.1 hypothetical protein PPTG_22474 [Phytophthora nicotianae INRA-310]